jgi:hypothetical protein
VVEPQSVLSFHNKNYKLSYDKEIPLKFYCSMSQCIHCAMKVADGDVVGGFCRAGDGTGFHNFIPIHGVFRRALIPKKFMYQSLICSFISISIRSYSF